MAGMEKHLATEFAVLKPDLRVETVAVSPSIYAELHAKFHQFAQHVLVSEHAFSENWSTWERHPAGDEVVVLLSGSAQVILRLPEGDERVVLTESGSFAVVPAGVWHTVEITQPTRMLFITPGEGTENREQI